jgi:hypothetical protein
MSLQIGPKGLMLKDLANFYVTVIEGENPGTSFPSFMEGVRRMDISFDNLLQFSTWSGFV